MTKNIRHVREHARRHEKDELHLKNLLKKEVLSEKLMGWFMGTLVFTLSTLIIFLNWGKIADFFTAPEKPPKQMAENPAWEIKGYRIGISTGQLVNGQVTNERMKKVNDIFINGYQLGLTMSQAINKGGEKTQQKKSEAYLSSVIFSQQLGHGDHLTHGQTSAGSLLQKAILTSYYLGEKTEFIHSALQNDAQLLSQINNTLKVDLFAYLNQSSSRSDSLDAYLNLLENLQDRATKRSGELQSQINFLNSNLKAQENTLKSTEEEFFSNLEMFNGNDADQKLTEFIGLQQNQSEARAKAGAYQKLKDYYDFFLPKLDVMIRAIQANRGPLVAGVRVVEIQDMQLELIVPEN